MPKRKKEKKRNLQPWCRQLSYWTKWTQLFLSSDCCTEKHTRNIITHIGPSAEGWRAVPHFRLMGCLYSWTQTAHQAPDPWQLNQFLSSTDADPDAFGFLVFLWAPMSPLASFLWFFFLPLCKMLASYSWNKLESIWEMQKSTCSKKRIDSYQTTMWRGTLTHSALLGSDIRGSVLLMVTQNVS
jgi:hypothetical protein